MHPCMLQVDQEHVKGQLRQEQQTWEDKQLAAGRSDSPPLQFWSIGKLLRVLQASLSAADPLAALGQYGISRQSVGSVDQPRATSQPTAPEIKRVPTADAVTYTSSRVWITGFLHFGEELDTCDILHLCDSSSRLPSFLVDPSPQLVDQLVLIKDWVLVDKTFGGVRTANSMFLEVHDEKPVALLPVNDISVKWPKQRVIEVLEANYQTKDPPMYTGTESWATVVSRLKGNGVDNDVVVIGTSDEQTAQRKRRKRQRIHVVFGRVTSVSPISRQKDRASSHFFVEIECHMSCVESTTQSVANVMFTGVHSMRWQLFLHPGKVVLLTDLVKVFSRECEMFLLQATHGHHQNLHVESEIGTLETLVLVWDDPLSFHKNSLQGIHASTDMYSKDVVSRYTGKLLDYEGRVSRLVWDECIELQGPDKTQVIVCLFHFPYTHELVRLRKGATIRVCGAHVLRWPTPVGGKLVIGLCPRSYFEIVSYGDPNGCCIVMSTRSRRVRAHKKWSCLGDFHRQSMVLSMWLLDVLELLDAKFFFGEDEHVQLRSSMVSFPRTRRRKAASLVANKFCFLPDDGHEQVAMTLGALFLKCHSANAGNCITVQLSSPREKLLVCNRVLTIRELQKFAESKLTEVRSADVRTSNGIRSLRILADALDWCIVIGRIRGNVDSGDLEVFDRTGSVSLCLNGSEMAMATTSECGVYLFRNFCLMIEDYNQNLDFQWEAKLPLVYCMSCSMDNVEYITIGGDEPFSFSPEENVRVDAEELREVVVVITHVDASPVSSIQSAGLLPEYRVLHGLVCPISEGLQTDNFLKSVYAADILVNTQCVSWCIQRGGCYTIKVLQGNKDGEPSFSRASVEDQAVKASINYWNKSNMCDGNSVLCFDSLKHFHCKKGAESINERCPFRVYQVESVQNAIVPIRLECDGVENVVCAVHDMCKDTVTDVFNTKQIVHQSSIRVTSSEYVAMTIITHFLRQSEEISQVCSLLHHPFTNKLQKFAAGTIDREQTVVKTVDPELHKPHLVSVVGIITKKKLYWKENTQKEVRGNLVNVATIGIKRGREDVSSTSVVSSRRLAYTLHVRDLQNLDTVEIRIDASRFGLLGALQLNNVVEFTRLQGFIARSSYKVYLNWSHLTAARLVDEVYSALPREAELYGSMSTTFLNDLYHASDIDRMLHRYVVGVVHISYVLLKRKCGLCHQALQLDKRRGCWKHADLQAESKYSRNCVWSWQQLSPSDPAFKTRTYMGTTVRCIIDDGSGQGELFLENDVTWELLTCTDIQRRRFEDILSNYVEELSYFSGRTTNGFFATSKAEREQEYYQNELRAFVLNAIPSLRSVVVFAQRFYKAKEKEGTSVLTFGKDIHITTKTVPQPKLEAKRVDRVHVRSELQQRLAQLRLRSEA